MKKPPINWVRSFEVAARHRNLSHAARELGVTHGAVSRQVAQLEAFLELTLVERSNAGLDLTAQGVRLAESLHEAFGQIDRAFEELKPGLRQLTVTVLPSFAVHWLVSRLGRFYAAHPDFEIRLLTTRRLVDLNREEVDLGLRYGRGGWPGLEAELLLEDQLYPVTAPDLARKVDMRTLGGFMRHIVHSDAVIDHENWLNWLKAAGYGMADLSRQPVYDDTGIAMQAALQGQAIILGRSSLVDGHIAAGRLVRLSDHAIQSPMAMYMAHRKGGRRRRDLAAFCSWIRSEAVQNEPSAQQDARVSQ